MAKKKKHITYPKTGGWIRVPPHDKIVNGKKVHIGEYRYKRTGRTDHYIRPGQYVKGHEIHQYDLARDRKTKAKRVRKPGEPSWRGDLKGKRI